MKKILYSLGIIFAFFIFVTLPSQAHAADRFWVRNATDCGGNWDDTDCWSETSGGSGGAATPTSSDDVYFNSSSGGGSAAINVAATVHDLDFTGYNGTLTGSSTLNISGSLAMEGDMTNNYNGTITFSATDSGNTLTFDGEQMRSSIIFNGTYNHADGGAEWTIQDSLVFAVNNTTTTLTRGSLIFANGANFGGFGHVSFNSSNSNERRLQLGNNTFHLGAGASNGVWDIADGTNMIFDAGTSTIRYSSTSPFGGGGLTYYIVEVNSTSAGEGPNSTINGNNTFHTLKRRPTSGYVGIIFGDNQTITNSLEIVGSNNSATRILARSSTVAAQRTITLAPGATVDLQNVDFSDIKLVRDGDPEELFGNPENSLGNAYGNAGINFTPAVNKYWVGNSGNWSDATKWSLDPDSDRTGGVGMPLPQDTAIFDQYSFSSDEQTITANLTDLRVSNVTWTGVTNQPTWASTNIQMVYGSIVLDPNMSLNISGQIQLRGRSLHTLDTLGKFLTTANLTVAAPGGKYTLATDFNTSLLTLDRGEFDANNKNVTLGRFASTNSNARTLTMGNGN